MSEESQKVDQDEIEELLKQQQAGGSAPAEQAASGEQHAATPTDQPASQPGAQGDSPEIGQDDIEALLAQQGAGAAPKPAAAPVGVASGPPAEIAQEDIELLLEQATSALASVDQPSQGPPLEAFKFEDFQGAKPSDTAATLELIRDVELNLRIELGRTHMHLEDVLRLHKGSVVPLDKLAGDPVDVYVNGRLVARGEVLVLNDNFCVRVAELLAGDTARSSC